MTVGLHRRHRGHPGRNPPGHGEDGHRSQRAGSRTTRWLSRYWGDACAETTSQGPPLHDGPSLTAAAGGRGPAGEERGFHAVAVDARARVRRGIATRSTHPFGLVVNADGGRCYARGRSGRRTVSDMGGGNLAAARAIGYAIWDARVKGLFLHPMYGPRYRDGHPGRPLPASYAWTARRWPPPADGSTRPSTGPGGDFTMAGKDAGSTEGLDPRRATGRSASDTPPSTAFPCGRGSTHLHRGRRHERGAVRTADGRHPGNVFAAGEIMSQHPGQRLTRRFGDDRWHGLGRIDGREEARHARGLTCPGPRDFENRGARGRAAEARPCPRNDAVSRSRSFRPGRPVRRGPPAAESLQRPAVLLRGLLPLWPDARDAHRLQRR